MRLKKDGIYFKDAQGRVRILHGVNLSGATKVPYLPDGATHILDEERFFEHRNISFIGRPFPLEDADEHYRRLKSWGLDFLRFLVTWEAIEHAGPGLYDEACLQYLEAVIEKAAEYDITIFIDFHQDVWSRFSGGDGAPGWTLEKVGFDMRHFKATGAAIVNQTYGNPFPRMIWASNYKKLASATMFTLFFGGNDFAPATKIDGQSAQDYLQGHYLNMMRTVAGRLKDKTNVLGYDLINEPSKGFIGVGKIDKMKWTFKSGDMPSPYQAMLLGAGYKQTVQRWHLGWFGFQRIGSTTIDPQGVGAWQEGVTPVWKANGVWDTNSAGQPVLLRPNHFTKADGEKISFTDDYMRPFINKAARALHDADPDAMSFVEFDAMDREDVPVWKPDVVEEEKIVYAPHWYPFILLMSKRYVSWVGLDALKSRPVFGRENKRFTYYTNLEYHLQVARNSFHGVPTVIGEIGIPYDLNNETGWRTGDWDPHIKAIDDYMYALEKNMLNYTLWNYTPANSNQWGDQWNGEDLSIFSYDQQTTPNDINSGGRALIAVVRPYARAIAGVPTEMHFDLEPGTFTFAFTHDASLPD
ncbi:MAG: cellulase family glycosylhydrolase, partial [Chloroflexota bacterium]